MAQRAQTSPQQLQARLRRHAHAALERPQPPCWCSPRVAGQRDCRRPVRPRRCLAASAGGRGNGHCAPRARHRCNEWRALATHQRDGQRHVHRLPGVHIDGIHTPRLSCQRVQVTESLHARAEGAWASQSGLLCTPFPSLAGTSMPEGGSGGRWWTAESVEKGQSPAQQLHVGRWVCRCVRMRVHLVQPVTCFRRCAKRERARPHEEEADGHAARATALGIL